MRQNAIPEAISQDASQNGIPELFFFLPSI
jgi:hypothetical protein